MKEILTATFFGQEADECPGEINCPNKADDPHTCPYAEEILDDHTTLCTCCKDCTRECAYDI